MTLKTASCVMEYDSFEIWEIGSRAFAISFDIDNKIETIERVRLVSESDLDDIIFPDVYDYCGEFFSEPTYGFYKGIYELTPTLEPNKWHGRGYDLTIVNGEKQIDTIELN